MVKIYATQPKQYFYFGFNGQFHNTTRIVLRQCFAYSVTSHDKIVQAWLRNQEYGEVLDWGGLLRWTLLLNELPFHLNWKQGYRLLFGSLLEKPTE